ncbi:UNVERIFIED_CONTAM: hypothetical protein PYX00_004956 [Menopon gallinae]|uniref:Small ribosomal subunit protein mS31 n=1 Tax=Menopon gallinae TaxID=328185 RepID=A0AAW2I6J1_9NEOP
MIILRTARVPLTFRTNSDSIFRSIATSQYCMNDDSDENNTSKKRYKMFTAKDKKKLDSRREVMRKANTVFDLLNSSNVIGMKNKDERKFKHELPRVSKADSNVFKTSHTEDRNEDSRMEPTDKSAEMEEQIESTISKLNKVIENESEILSTKNKLTLSQPTKAPKNIKEISAKIMQSARSAAIEIGGDTDKISIDLINSIKKLEASYAQVDKTDLAVDILSKPHQSRLSSGETLGIFNKQNGSPEVSTMPTWDYLHKLSLVKGNIKPPKNYFEELIQWTNQGKLWNFPIDNEQGLDEEMKVDFTEHIFLEKHLEPWCPKTGPLRHFMELVIIGLSKNPYMSSQEKKEHIMWYKNYFEAHGKLLREIGAFVEKNTNSVNIEE